MQQIQGDLRRFVIDNFLFGKEDRRLSNDDSLLENGIMDSTSVLELVGFLENQYGVKIEDEDLVPENLDSVNSLASFLQRKLQASQQGEHSCR